METLRRTGGLQRAAATAVALGALLLALPACETKAPKTGLQVWQKGWPGAPSPETSESFHLEADTLECAVDANGDIVFQTNTANRGLQFPDGSSIRADTFRVSLQRKKEAPSHGVGPHVLCLRLGGDVKLKGPFPPCVEAFIGETVEGGEAVSTDIPNHKGPMVVRCPIDLVAVWATGRTLIFGTSARPGETPAEGAAPPEGGGAPPEGGTAPEGGTPPEGETKPPEDGTTPEGGSSPGETPDQPEGGGEK